MWSCAYCAFANDPTTGALHCSGLILCKGCEQPKIAAAVPAVEVGILLAPPPSAPPRATALYARAPGKPMCPYGTKCYRKNSEHFADYDHPAGHELFIKEPAAAAALASGDELPDGWEMRFTSEVMLVGHLRIGPSARSARSPLLLQPRARSARAPLADRAHAHAWPTTPNA